MLLTKSQKVELLLKHARKFADKSMARPYLRGIHYGADKCAYVTDAKIALRIGGMDIYDRPITFDAWSGEEIQVQYPDVQRVFNEVKDAKIDIKLYNVINTAKCIKNMLEVAKAINQEEMKATLYCNPAENDTVWFKYFQPTAAVFDLAIGFVQNYSPDLEPFHTVFDIMLFYKAISVFADAKSEQLTIKFIDTLRPLFMFDEQNDISTIVMPRRG